jgi:hypothetical protein
MIPPDLYPNWQRRIITLYYSNAEKSISNDMGALWFHPDTVVGSLSVQPIRYVRYVDTHSVLTCLTDMEKYDPSSYTRVFSNRPNTSEYFEKYGSLLIMAGLVDQKHQTIGSPPAMPWDKPFKQLRDEFWKSLPNDSTIVELGVDKAGTASDLIIPLSKPKKLYLIDPWDLVNEDEQIWFNSKANREAVQDLFKDNPKVEVLQSFSQDAAEKFENEYFDVVFSDWALTYEQTKVDIFTWLKKIKPGGFLCGDLFCLEDHHWSGAFGAIMEFMAKYVLKDTEIITRQERSREVLLFNLIDKYEKSNKISDVNFYMTEHPFGDILVRYNSTSFTFNGFHTRREKCEDIIQIKPDYPTLLSLAKNPHFTYYPSGRTRAGTWKLQIGDWIDDLDFEEFEKWAKTETDNVWIPVEFER